MHPFERPVLVIGLLFLSVAVISGSGAFSAITADRSATVTVAGDDSALLAISQHADADPGLFGSGDTLSIQVSPGATTTYEVLFNVTNQGTQPVAVWIEDHDYTSGGGSGDLAGDIVGDLDADNTGNVTFFNTVYGGSESCENGVASVEGVGNAVELAPGQTLVVGLQANTSDVAIEEVDLLDEMTIYANATVPGVSTALNTPC